MEEKDREFMDTLYRKYYKSLVIDVYKLIDNKSDTTDIVNMAFEWCMRNYHTGRTSYKIMHHHIKGVCIHVANQMNKNQKALAEKCVFATIVDKNPEDLVLNSEKAKEIMKVIKSMCPRYREVLLLSIVHGLQPCEIGARLSIKPNTAAKRLARGRKKLAILLIQKGYNIQL